VLGQSSVLQEAVLLDTAMYAHPDGGDAVLIEARDYAVDVAARLKQQSVSAEGLAQRGDIPRTITETAKSVNADWIVMRTHARTGAARAVLGSVADAVVRSSLTPVMLLREAASVSQDAPRRERSTTEP
jgi:nucleotide-binding universal stress UspA family protein